MKTKYIKIGFSILATALLASCNSFLDTLPDNRGEITSDEKAISLLVSAYPDASELYVTEMMSDNTAKHNWNLAAEIDQEQFYYWKDIQEKGNDTPDRLWSYCYKSIASANTVLEYIETAPVTDKLLAAKGEALICRAFNHYLLANVFCMPYGANSTSLLGIHYMKEVERTIGQRYERGTLEETYKYINQDIEDALPLIDDGLHAQLKFHFNRKSAYAFAAQFNLLYGKFDKVIEYSTQTLGANPASQLRDWKALAALSANDLIQPNKYTDISEKATLLMNFTISNWGIYGGPYGSGEKYSHSSTIARNETVSSIGAWGNDRNLNISIFNNPMLNKVIVRKVGAYFNLKDPVANTGYYYINRVHFSTDETLLHRAEAHILQGDLTKGFADISTFMNGFAKNTPSYSTVISFYTNSKYDEEQVPSPMKNLEPPLYTIKYKTDQEYLLHYLLHIKRILNIHEGQRWIDIKRYGITVYRRTYNRADAIVAIEDVLKPNDLRRAIQIPPEALNAGHQANPR